MRITRIYAWLMLWGAAVLLPAAAGSVVGEAPDWRDVPMEKGVLYDAAKTILKIQGFKMQRLDEAAGILETAVSPMRLNLSGCDCDTGVWASMEDTRPLLQVAVAVAVEDNRISIRARIDGDYPKDQISPAVIEDDLFMQIVRYLE